MSLLKQLKEELKQKGKLENLTRRNRILLEQTFFKDNKNKGCEKCQRKENPTLDHIVPKDILKQFGIDIDTEFIEDNLRILCKTCNTFKGNRLDFSTPKTKEILLKILERV